MSNTKLSNESENNEIEISLKELIEKIIKFYEVYRIEDYYLKEYEKRLNSSETLLEILEIIKRMFVTLMEFTLNQKDEFLECSNISIFDKDKKNQNFEKILFNYEKEINKHIKNEFKLKEIIKFNQIEIKELKKDLVDTKINLKRLKWLNKNFKLKNKNNNYKSSFNITKNYNKINQNKSIDLFKKILNKSVQRIKINSFICKEKTVNIKKIQNLMKSKIKYKNKLNIKRNKSFNKKKLI